MAITQRLELRQGQALVMTPQLQQAIKLLQLSNLELAAFVEQELERNPLLECDESMPDAGESAQPSELPPDNSSTDTLRAHEDFSQSGNVDAEHEDMDYAGETSPPAPNLPLADWSGLRTGTVSPDQDSFLERALARPLSLHDHLLAQLAISGAAAADRLIAVALIDGIDETGYLRADTGDIGARLSADPHDVERVLGMIHGFEPTGVGARNLSECLALQLREKDRLDPAMTALLSNSNSLRAGILRGFARAAKSTRKTQPR